MDNNVEDKKEAMLKRLANRHGNKIFILYLIIYFLPLSEKRLLDQVKSNTKKIDLRATERAFLESSPTSMNMRTPLNPSISSSVSDSPILSYDEKANKQIIALATWCNTMMELDVSEEMDLGESKAEACRNIQKMLKKRSDTSEVENTQENARRRYQRIFEKNDPEVVKKKCKQLLDDSGMDASIKDLLSKNNVAIRKEHAVYNDIGLQTTLLHTFLSFHPAWLKTALEAIFNTRIDAQPKHLMKKLSQFFLDLVFSNPTMLKNKKFAQGSGK